MFSILFGLIQLFGAAKPCGDPPQFFGLKPWYEYIYDNDHFSNTTNTGCSLKSFTIFPGPGQESDVPLVLLAIVDDLLRVAGMVAVGFVIVGAIKYVTSQGNSEATGKAQSTIINALIGLAIAIVAITFVSFVANRISNP